MRRKASRRDALRLRADGVLCRRPVGRRDATGHGQHALGTEKRRIAVVAKPQVLPHMAEQQTVLHDAQHLIEQDGGWQQLPVFGLGDTR